MKTDDELAGNFRLEYLYGTKHTRNDASHDGQRLLFVIKYNPID